MRTLMLPAVVVLSLGCRGNTLSVCGDGEVALDGDGVAVEACDDGNALSGDYCSADCSSITGACGDASIQTNEACDDGVNDGAYGGCTSECSLAPRCGDSVVDEQETCDDGLLDGGYGGCFSDCTLASRCGDGIWDPSREDCDDGVNDGTYGTCSPGCRTAPACGDAIRDLEEACDDGNTASDDYCGADCQTVTGWCNDGIVQSNEGCEDGGNAPGDGCDEACQVESGWACPSDSDCFRLLYVDQDAAGANDGSSWADAFNDLQDALAVRAMIPGEVWVAEGTYLPGEAETDTFVLPDGTELYGGFAATETRRSERDSVVNRTLLSGDIGGPGSDSTVKIDRIAQIEAESTVILDGFVLAGAEGDKEGAGLWVDGTASLIHLDFSDNIGRNGGGLYVGPHATLLLDGLTFTGNEATDSGGGAAFVGSPVLVGAAGQHHELTGAVFTGNTAARGAGLFATRVSMSVSDVTLSENVAVECGGGASFAATTALSVTQAQATGNTARCGGAFHLAASQAANLQEVTATGNVAEAFGGAIAANAADGLVVSYSTFSGNTAGTNGGAIAQIGQGASEYKNSSIVNNEAGENGGGLYFSNDNFIGMRDLVLDGNHAVGDGGGAYVRAEDGYFNRMAFLHNTADGDGGGFVMDGIAFNMLANSLFWDNQAVNGGGVVQRADTGALFMVNLTLVENVASANGGGAHFESDSDSCEGVDGWPCVAETRFDAPNLLAWGNASGDSNTSLSGTWEGDEGPLVTAVDVESEGPESVFVDHEAGDFRLAESSPAIDVGSSISGPAGVTASKDLDGAPRVFGSAMDVGAYEWSP